MVNERASECDQRGWVYSIGKSVWKRVDMHTAQQAVNRARKPQKGRREGKPSCKAVSKASSKEINLEAGVVFFIGFDLLAIVPLVLCCDAHLSGMFSSVLCAIFESNSKM